MPTVPIDPRLPTVAFAEPSERGYLYLGVSAKPLGRGPFVGRDAARDRGLARLIEAAGALKDHPHVTATTVFCAVLAPPIPGRPDIDLALLVETGSPRDLAEVRDSPACRRIGAVVEVPARNVRRFGDTNPGRRGSTFLFNHFTGPDTDTAIAVWETLTGWFTDRTGIDNSTLLAPTGDSPYAMINFARLPSGPRRFLARQLTKPSFTSFVRSRLREHGMTSYPIFHKAA